MTYDDNKYTYYPQTVLCRYADKRAYWWQLRYSPTYKILQSNKRRPIDNIPIYKILQRQDDQQIILNLFTKILHSTHK